MSIQRLSNPNEEPIFDQRLLNNKNSTAGKNLISFNQNFNNQPKDWKELVQKRIEAKTRIKKVNLTGVIIFIFTFLVLIRQIFELIEILGVYFMSYDRFMRSSFISYVFPVDSVEKRVDFNFTNPVHSKAFILFRYHPLYQIL